MIGGRTLLQALGLYAAGSWLVLQVVDVLKDNMGLPDWVFPFAFVLLLIGLPIILTTAVVQRRLGTQPRVSDDQGDGDSLSEPESADAASGASAEIRGLFTWRNTLVGGGLAFLLLVLSTGAFMYMRGAGIGPVGSLVAAGVLEEKAKVVLADFEAEDETLGRTVTESFRVDLAQSPVIRLVGPDSIADALARMGHTGETDLSEETARELAQRDGIPAVIAGEVSPVGSGYVLTARLLAASDGVVLASARASAPDEAALLGAIDEVSSKLRERIGESYTSLRETPPLAHVTTGSLAALRKYTESRDAAYRDEDFEAAIRLLEEAVAIDSTFALAWRGLATHLRNLGGNWERRVEALEAAYRHRDRLTEYERYLVEGTYHSDLTRDREKAIAAFEAILRIDPHDSRALNNIGVNYWEQADFEEALIWYRRAVRESEGDRALHIANMGVVHANLGNLDSAAAWYARLDSFPPNMLFEDYRANLLWLAGDEEAFRAEMERLSEESRGERGRSRAERAVTNLEVLHGRVQSVIEEVERRADQELAVGDADASVRSLREAAWLQFEVLGDTTAALATADRAIERIESESSSIQDPPWGSYGRLLILAGDVERGRDLMDRDWASVPEQRRRWFESERAADMRFLVARGSGRPEEALQAFRSLPPDTCQPCDALETARLFDDAGRADSALVYYERYLEIPYNFRVWVDARNLADVHERLGQLYDERGDLENAALHYAAFVELWADSDPVLQPRVQAAQVRLEAIVGERG